MVPRFDSWRNFHSLHTAVVCGELIIFIGRIGYFCNCGNLAPGDFFVILAIISGVLIGLWRGEIGRKGVEVYDSLIGKVAIIQGQVLEDPDLDKNSQTVLRLGNLRMNNENCRDKFG